MSYDVNQEEKKCKFCETIAKKYDFENLKKNDKNGVYLDFQGDLNFLVKISDGKFYIVSEWLGCPKYTEELCSGSNGRILKMQIKYCPICGKKMTIHRLLKNQKKR